MIHRTRWYIWIPLALLLVNCRKTVDESELRPMDGIGGNFTLTGTDGKPFQLNDLRGKTVLLFFGYTACPDWCPTTMARLSRVYEDLRGRKLEDRVKTIFISVDPGRDTPEKIREYLNYFSVRSIGLTGSTDALAAVAKQYGAFFELEPADASGRYLVNHTTYVYLIDGQGRIRRLIRPEDTPERITELVSTIAQEP